MLKVSLKDAILITVEIYNHENEEEAVKLRDMYEEFVTSHKGERSESGLTNIIHRISWVLHLKRLHHIRDIPNAKQKKYSMIADLLAHVITRNCKSSDRVSDGLICLMMIFIVILVLNLIANA